MSASFIPVERNELILLRQTMAQAIEVIDKKLQGKDKEAVVSTPAPRKGLSVREQAMQRRDKFHEKKKPQR